MGEVTAQVSDVPDEHFAYILIPFLRFYAKTSLKVDESSRFQTLVRTVVRAYSKRHVGLEPARPQNWSRPRGDCKCPHCWHLNGWFINPKQKQIRFEGIGQVPTKHLEGRLPWEIDCVKEHDRDVSPHALIVTKTQRRWEIEYSN